MNDAIGNPLVPGEYVIFRMPKYSDITIGRVRAFTAKKVYVEYVNDWNFSKPGYAQEILIAPDTLCVIHGPRREPTITAFENKIAGSKKFGAQS